ncbi:MAG: hypothetical protein LBN24_09115 [Mediterranea sp.]|jgi:hypothetical protein|nr:hypothetical protein [Mediterranea sp.]
MLKVIFYMFCERYYTHGNHWQIGLKQYADALSTKGMYLYSRPMHKDASYLIDFDKDKLPVFHGPTLC